MIPKVRHKSPRFEEGSRISGFPSFILITFGWISTYVICPGVLGISGARFWRPCHILRAWDKTREILGPTKLCGIMS